VVDITRNLLKESQEDRLADFNEEEKNLIVAMEEIDLVVASFVGTASWAQSREKGRGVHDV